MDSAAAHDESEMAAAMGEWLRRGHDMTAELLLRFAAIDGPSGDPDSLEASTSFLIDELQRLDAGTTTHRTSAGVHLEARFGPPAGRPVLILCHYDTVWPRGTAVDRPPRRDGDVIRGPGVFDMRGGLVAALRGVEALLALDLLRRPVVLLLTADEETDSATSEPIIRRLAGEAETILIPEPCTPDGALKTRRKGALTYELEVRGQAAHAGVDADSGASAVHALGSLIVELEGERRPAAGTTVNVGWVRGGTMPNVIAERASAGVDLRMWSSAEYDRLVEVFAALGQRTPQTETPTVADRLGVTVTARLVDGRGPVELTPAIAGAVADARRIAGLMGMELAEGATGGTSDGNLLAPLDLRVLDGLGPQGGGAHAVDEWVSARSLTERSTLIGLLAGLI
jgi:glutamate carboxypeptidase